MKILKFGGSSVGNAERIQAVGNIILQYARDKTPFAVVVSAMRGVTDQLIRMADLAERGDEAFREEVLRFSRQHTDAARELLKPPFLGQVLPQLENNHQVLESLLQGVFLVREASPRTMDYVLSFGERNSAFLISRFLEQKGLPVEYLDGRRIIQTDKRFGFARVQAAATREKIRQHFAQTNDIQIVTGFIGASAGGLTTTLGRGGSDYTASLLAAALEAEVLEIWTDVDGVLTADPRQVEKAFTLPGLSYAEATELSHFGAKVIYPPTIRPVREKGIPILIRNTFRPDFPGTRISERVEHRRHPVTGISSLSGLSLLTLQGSGLVGVPGSAARLFSSLARREVNVVLITQGSSEQTISFAVIPEQVKKARKAVTEEFESEMKKGSIDPVQQEDKLSVIAVIGERMRYQPGIAGRLFQALGKNGINVVAIAQGSSERNISVVVGHQDEPKALNALHEAFFLSDVRELHLFVVGVGLIGSTLLEQIRRQAAFLREKMGTEIRVVGLANSRQMRLDPRGIELEHWPKELEERGESMDLEQFLQRMKAMNLPNSIFVDNTAEKSLADRYHEILEASISISTPNKNAPSDTFARYRQLKELATRKGAQFHYETNVGAGLPILSTLQDLMISGDRILRIQGVFSGSMSFIFNALDDGMKFSEAVRRAAEGGLTEPDPREDLSGNDVRRKLVILARESGLPLEMEQVELEPWLPDTCLEADSVEAFFRELEQWEPGFNQRAAELRSQGKRLRFLADLDRAGHRATLGVTPVGPESPFYHLNGSDNMIVFTTDRYRERPLVVRGPGAGAEVTAAGVFAEILKIGNYLS